ncbi:hypothetical protein FOZ63_030227 [Perkinsus olseni]|uniref:Uncharacterized protein n=1 Tax=Perkinsus olseni TaxID=32597 RepID=A0A7J6N8I8_PEROL|nr:hypothetical protein FOZ63_030227 [Perkinsus olseni]
MNPLEGPFSSRVCTSVMQYDVPQTSATELGEGGRVSVAVAGCLIAMFSVDNDILTPSFKLKRNVAVKVFQKEVDALYEQIGKTVGPRSPPASGLAQDSSNVSCGGFTLLPHFRTAATAVPYISTATSGGRYFSTCRFSDDRLGEIKAVKVVARCL